MAFKTDKQLSDDFDKALKINDCGLSTRAWMANILVLTDLDCPLMHDIPDVSWPKIKN